MVAFMGSAANVALPSIGEDLKANTVTLGWIATVYLLSAGMFSVPAGKIADLYGRRRILLMGIAIYGLGSFLSGLSPNAVSLLIFRFLQGIGAAMVFATVVAILTSTFPSEERGKAIGINTGCVYGGLSAGPFIGGMLTENLGWRSVFLINVPFCLLAFFAGLRLKGEWAEAAGERFDALGAVLYVFALLFLIYGLTEGLLPALISGGILSLILVLYEARQRYPVLDVSLFRTNPTFSLSSIAALLNYASTFAVSFLLSLYLQHIKALSPQQTGLVLIAQPVTMTILAPVAGWFSDRIEPRVVASAGMATTAVSLVLLSGIGETTGIPSIVLYLVLLGSGLALFSSPNTSAIMGSVESKFYGLASAIVSTVRLMGQMISLAVATLAISLVMGSVPLEPSAYPLFVRSSKISFWIFVILCTIGFFASLSSGKVLRRGPGGKL